MKPTVASLTENARHHRVLGGWRDVLDDIREFCRTIDELPGMCACGHGPAHLENGCPCCGHTATDYVPACADCDLQLARLRPSIDGMTVDTFRFFPFVNEFLTQHDPASAGRARAIGDQITALRQSFERLVFAAGEFRSNCRAEHLDVLKQAAAALRRDAEALNRSI